MAGNDVIEKRFGITFQVMFFLKRPPLPNMFGSSLRRTRNIKPTDLGNFPSAQETKFAANCCLFTHVDDAERRLFFDSVNILELFGEIADKSSVTSRRKLPAEAENNAMGRLEVTQNNRVKKEELEDQVPNPSEGFTLVFSSFSDPTEMLLN